MAIKRMSMKIVPCPNPECPEAEGCCVCEYSGYVREWIIDAMTIEPARATEQGG